MEHTFLILTSIAGSDNTVIKELAAGAKKNSIPFIIIGDVSSPLDFKLEDCDFYSVHKQKELQFKLAEILPYKHYARKNLGYLIAISNSADIIIETDDDNIPHDQFWQKRKRITQSHLIKNSGWVNTYKYFTKKHIWPRGFAMEHILDEKTILDAVVLSDCPIQQGLADDNPDVDAIYRLTAQLPVKFEKRIPIALGNNSICPFNSQNTTWFKEAFPLMYLPSYCSFRMTDIWRSFVAQRIAWTCGWNILFHNSTVFQERNIHNLLKDFLDEIPGYLNNTLIMKQLCGLKLKEGVENINKNMLICYNELIKMDIIEKKELLLLEAWFNDISLVSSNL